VTPSRTAQRLQRLLALVPYVVRHPGTKVDELSRLFDVSESELTNDLNLLFVTGLPPYGPGDLIDVLIEDGRVWIGMADYFSRPVRLTRAEALALYLKGTELLGAPGLSEAEALRTALAKLEERLGPESLGTLRAEVEEGGRRIGPLEAIRTAVDSRERIEIDYYSATRDEMTTRRIDPEHLFGAIGNWYVVAWCHLVEDERLFRVDRIRDVRGTGETFEPRGLLGQGRPLYTPRDEDIRVRLRLGPRARWVAEYYEVERVRSQGDLLEVILPTKDLAWTAKLILRLGGEAEVLEPEELKALAGRVAAETIALYENGADGGPAGATRARSRKSHSG
jgi:proteasome accessory factor C